MIKALGFPVTGTKEGFDAFPQPMEKPGAKQNVKILTVALIDRWDLSLNFIRSILVKTGYIFYEPALGFASSHEPKAVGKHNDKSCMKPWFLIDHIRNIIVCAVPVEGFQPS
ncbi:MAG: hypothetical protein P8L18_10150 [Verrucomicrobiota bacterium]|nr:hypothetical protein [Verrucomicrobiota bacterium]